MHNSARANVILQFARLVWGLQRALGSGSAAVLLQLGGFNQRNAYASSPSFKERYRVTALPLTAQLSTAPPLQNPSGKPLNTFYSFMIFFYYYYYFMGF